jgi:transcriptional regulator with XRE-family HTH domain
MDFSAESSKTPKRFCAVNAVGLRELRLTCGWSQAELARRSGYTARLIRKAESGGTLNYESIVDLAETFTACGTAVRAEELLFDPVSIVKEFVEAYERLGAECIQRLTHYFSPSIQLECLVDPVCFPFAGTWSGLEPLRDFFQRFCRQYSRLPERLLVVYLLGNECVSARFKDILVFHGLELPATRFNWHFQFQAGMISRIDFEFDHFTASQHRLTRMPPDRKP